jgi:uncharacterized protein YndB with AHSA1/START domain
MKPFKHSFESPASPQAAYEAVATKPGIQGWWCKDCDVATKAGGSHHMRFDKQGTLVNMRFIVDELDENKSVVWTCIDNDNPIWKGSTLTWTFAKSPEGSRVSFVHDGFADGGSPYEATMQGWVMFMKSLETYLAGGQGSPF